MKERGLALRVLAEKIVRGPLLFLLMVPELLLYHLLLGGWESVEPGDLRGKGGSRGGGAD